MLDTLAFFFGRSSSDESELESDDSDELLSAFRLRVFVVTVWSLGFTEVVVVSANLELLSLSSSASLSEDEDEEDEEEDDEEDEEEEEDDEEEDEDDDERARFAPCLVFTVVFGFFLAACSELDESSVLLSLLLELVDAFDFFDVSILAEAFL